MEIARIGPTPTTGTGMGGDLIDKLSKFCFVIMRTEDSDLWKRCCLSIRVFYPNFQIVVINEVLNFTTPNVLEFTNIEFYPQLLWRNAGAMAIYYAFLREKWAENMILLTDSMFMKRPFLTSEINSANKCGWMGIWSTPSYVDFDDVLFDNFFSFLDENKKDDLIGFSRMKTQWNGCYKLAGIVSHSWLLSLEETYKIFSYWIPLITDTKSRAIMELAFPLIIQHSNQKFRKYEYFLYGSIREYHGFQQDDYRTQLKNTDLYPYAVMTTF